MIIRTMKLSDLQLAPYNPRKDLRPGDKEYEEKQNKKIDYNELLKNTFLDVEKQVISIASSINRFSSQIINRKKEEES